MLYIMRHGRTDWNVLHKLQGKTDIPLNEEGRIMAHKAAQNHNLQFDVCYCSPLIRAKETAEIFLKGKNTPIYIDKRLEEMAFGIYEGMKDCFKIKDCPINDLFFKPQDYKPAEGGESLDELFKRTGEFIDEVINPGLASGKDILIVSHGAAIHCIIAQYKNIPPERFWEDEVENCELIRLV